MHSSVAGGLGILAVDDLPHLWAGMASSEKAPKLVALAAEISRRWGWEYTRMSIIGELLAKCFAIGIAAAGAFVIATYALNSNWL
jgi:hypothetical protein